MTPHTKEEGVKEVKTPWGRNTVHQKRMADGLEIRKRNPDPEEKVI